MRPDVLYVVSGTACVSDGSVGLDARSWGCLSW